MAKAEENMANIDQSKTDYSTSCSDITKESSSSTALEKNNNNQISSYEYSPEQIGKISPSMLLTNDNNIQSHVPQFCDMPRDQLYEAPKSSLPRLFFAEWLSLDHDQQQQIHGPCAANIDVVPGTKFVVPREGFGHGALSFQDSIGHGFLMNENSIFGGDFQTPLSHGSISEHEMINSDFKFVDQISGSGNIVDFISGSDLCNIDFNNIHSDAMYI